MNFDEEEKRSATSETTTSRKRRGPYPGIYLATAAARMIRPVWHRKLDEKEILGPMEQVYLNIVSTKFIVSYILPCISGLVG